MCIYSKWFLLCTFYENRVFNCTGRTWPADCESVGVAQATTSVVFLQQVEKQLTSLQKMLY
jgi:hypothetical protein